jgi:hypothetical protein
MKFSEMTDENLLALYEDVRQQVELDKQTRGEFRFAGEGVMQHAQLLRKEMDRRQLQYSPIDLDS